MNTAPMRGFEGGGGKPDQGLIRTIGQEILSLLRRPFTEVDDTPSMPGMSSEIAPPNMGDDGFDFPGGSVIKGIVSHFKDPEARPPQ